ncbi:MAG TPA: hypothetical protein VJN70_00525 [Gemmatimonadaceae bacterium]|nr:hypothetical protein [Gemmatimonadaceae bacterium]
MQLLRGSLVRLIVYEDDDERRAIWLWHKRQCAVEGARDIQAGDEVVVVGRGIDRLER